MLIDYLKADIHTQLLKPPMSKLDMAIGAIVAAAILTPEGRGVSTQTAGAIGGLGNKILKNKLGIDMNDITGAFETPGKENENDTRE